MSELSLDDLRSLVPELRAANARVSLRHFGKLMLPSYEDPSHVRLLCDRLEALERRDIRRLLVFQPPRTSKTTHVSQLFPAWWLGRRSSESLILASYGAELAEGNSRRARALVADPRYPFETSIAADSSAVNRWHTTDGGGVIAAGVGGAITGFGADALIIDDPVKDRADADSAAVRESTWKWFTEVALTRLMPGAVVLVTLTRWHEDDVAGRIMNSTGADEWEVLKLPALAEEKDPLGRADGEPLWPEWYPLEVLEERRRDLGERAFAALYQQRPAPAEGAMFKRSWLDGRYARSPESGLKIVTAVDASFGKSVQSDFSAIVTAASDGKNFYVLGATRGRWAFNELRQAVTHAHETWGAPVVCEDAAAGQSLIQELRRDTGVPIIAVKPEGSKAARAESVTPLFESERVFFPDEASRWRDELIEELASFPAGRHDDQVDALVYALERLRGGYSSGGVAGAVVSRNQKGKPGTPDQPLSEYEARKRFPWYRDPRFD